MSDYTAIAAAALPITTVAWVADVVTATLPAAHGITVGQIVPLTIAGVTPAGYNGTYTVTNLVSDGSVPAAVRGGGR